MNRSLLLAAAFCLAASHALAQPDATTDVDATTTPAEQSPLAPEQAQTEKPKPQTIEDIISGAAPYEPPPAPAAQAAPDAPPDVVVAVPAAPAVAPLQPQTAGVPQPTPAPTARPTGPVYITDESIALERARSATDAAYENRVLGVFHSAQGKQGPLDGRWQVQSGGVALYTLQLSDPGAGEGRVEGAWRNLRNAGANSSGFVDEVTREGDQVVVRFTDTGFRRTEVRLTPNYSGGWTGEAVWPEGRQTIVMSRDQSVEVQAFAVPAYIPPPPPPPPKARPVAKKKSKKSTAAKAKKRRPTASPSRARAKRR